MQKSMYLTWYEFKKDLQKEARHSILNQEWRQIKPQEPLPWDKSYFRSALSKLASRKN
jgi:hypothetical protein